VLQQNYDKKHISDLLASVGAIINQSAYPLENQVMVRQTGSSRSDDKPKEEFSGGNRFAALSSLGSAV
jgi:hypothetical protein